MADYRRVFVPGGTYFFTVVTAGRRAWLGTTSAIHMLGRAMREVREGQHFDTVALVVLPDHLHAIWTLPEHDVDYARRWRRIKQRTTLLMRSRSGLKGRLWQPRYWEHCIRDERSLQQHIDYIHFNPVRHGLAATAADWEASTFHRFVEAGIYEPGWASPPELMGVAE